VVGTFGTNAVQLWNPDTRQRLATLAGHAKPVESVACGPDGIVASSGFDGSIRLWSVERRSEVGRFDPAAPVNQVSFSRDGRLLAGAESGLPLRLWDVAGRREAASIPIRPYSYGAAAVAFSPAHDVFAFSTQDEVLLWAYVRSPG
jgi:WD40 repeat protein